MGLSARHSIMVPANLVEPLTVSNKAKGIFVSELMREWDTVRSIVEKTPECLIGLRIRTKVTKTGLFYRGQRGVCTDIKISPEKIYIFITWDNIVRGDAPAIPPQRIV